MVLYFRYTAAGTENTPPTVTDIVTLSQGDRGIIEFTPTNKGMMMIHSHVNGLSHVVPHLGHCIIITKTHYFDYISFAVW
jgi:hypothetical protein